MTDEIIPNRCYNINQNDAKTKEDFGNDGMVGEVETGLISYTLK
jgi:hypothetical protein